MGEEEINRKELGESFKREEKTTGAGLLKDWRKEGHGALERGRGIHH